MNIVAHAPNSLHFQSPAYGHHGIVILIISQCPNCYYFSTWIRCNLQFNSMLRTGMGWNPPGRPGLKPGACGHGLLTQKGNWNSKFFGDLILLMSVCVWSQVKDSITESTIFTCSSSLWLHFYSNRIEEESTYVQAVITARTFKTSTNVRPPYNYHTLPHHTLQPFGLNSFGHV